MTNMVGSEKFAVVATIDPDVLTVTTHSSDGVDMSLFESVTAIAMVGTLASGSTVICKVTSGSNNVAFGNTVKTATTLTQAGSDGDKQVVINVRGSQLTPGDRYIRLEMVVGTDVADGGGIVLGHNPVYSPASDHDLSTVDEITVDKD